MSRITRAGLLAALSACALMAAGVAVAASKRVHLTGGTTAVTITPAAKSFLAKYGVGVSAIAPATTSGGNTLTLPVKGGQLNPANLKGVVTHKGGIKFTKGKRVLAFRAVTINGTGKVAKVSAFALLRHRCGNGKHKVRYCFRAGRVVVATLTNVQRPSVTPAGTIAATADLKLSNAAARAINERLGKHVVNGGTVFATGALNATTAP
jgi:hypothetical protein